MLAIVENTENILLDDLKKDATNEEYKFCYYLEFSKIQLDKNFWYLILINRMHEMKQSSDAKIYLCQDQDVFIMIKGLKPLAFDMFVEKLSKDLEFSGLPNFTEILDICKQWKKLELICLRKIAAINAVKNNEEKRKIEESQNALIELDAELISTLKNRRNKRKTQDVLVVDDDQTVRALINSILSKDYEVSFAEDGRGAVQSYVARAPDVLFLDIGLPDINGHDVLKSIFQIDPDAYVVMFSGRQDEKNVKKAISLGAKGYVIKPFSKEKLMSYIQKSPFIQDKKNAA